MLEHVEIFGIAIDWYWLIVVPTAAICFFSYIKLLNSAEWQNRYELLLMVTILFISGFVGGKLFSIIEWRLLIGQDIPLNDMLAAKGTRLYGVIITGLFTFTLFFFLNKPQNSVHVFDKTAIVACGGFAVGKIGCFLSGHPGCYGIETSLPWGIDFAYQGQSIGYNAHPLQIYDSIFLSICFLVLLMLSRKIWGKGYMLPIFLILFSLYCIFIDYLKQRNELFMNLSIAQLSYIIITIQATSLLWLSRKSGQRVVKSNG